MQKKLVFVIGLFLLIISFFYSSSIKARDFEDRDTTDTGENTCDLTIPSIGNLDFEEKGENIEFKVEVRDVYNNLEKICLDQYGKCYNIEDLKKDANGNYIIPLAKDEYQDVDTTISLIEKLPTPTPCQTKDKRCGSSQPCCSGLSCVRGYCTQLEQSQKCTENETKCENNRVYTCNDQGVFISTQRCDFGCEANKCKRAPEKASYCVDNKYFKSFKKNSTAIETTICPNGCNAQGCIESTPIPTPLTLRCGSTQPCPSGLSCVRGYCTQIEQSQKCTENETKCENNRVYTCNDQGAFISTQRCDFGCNGKTCKRAPEKANYCVDNKYFKYFEKSSTAIKTKICPNGCNSQGCIEPTPTPNPVSNTDYKCEGNILTYQNQTVDTCQYGCNQNLGKCNPMPSNLLCNQDGQTSCSADSNYIQVCKDGKWINQRICPAGCKDGKCEIYYFEDPEKKGLTDTGVFKFLTGMEIINDINSFEPCSTIGEGRCSGKSIRYVCTTKGWERDNNSDMRSVCISGQWKKVPDYPQKGDPCTGIGSICSEGLFCSSEKNICVSKEEAIAEKEELDKKLPCKEALEDGRIVINEHSCPTGTSCNRTTGKCDKIIITEPENKKQTGWDCQTDSDCQSGYCIPYSQDYKICNELSEKESQEVANKNTTALLKAAYTGIIMAATAGNTFDVVEKVTKTGSKTVLFNEVTLGNVLKSQTNVLKMLNGGLGIGNIYYEIKGAIREGIKVESASDAKDVFFMGTDLTVKIPKSIAKIYEVANELNGKEVKAEDVPGFGHYISKFADPVGNGLKLYGGVETLYNLGNDVIQGDFSWENNTPGGYAYQGITLVNAYEGSVGLAQTVGLFGGAKSAYGFKPLAILGNFTLSQGVIVQSVNLVDKAGIDIKIQIAEWSNEEIVEKPYDNYGN